MPDIIRKGVTLTEAIQEAAAIAPIGRQILRAFELYHPALAEPIRFVDDVEPLEATLEATAPRDAGDLVEFLACPLAHDPAGEDDSDSPQAVKIGRPDVGGVLKQALDIAREWPDPSATWELIERLYASDDLSKPTVLPTLSLEPTNFEISGGRGMLEAIFDDDANFAVPGITFRRSEYPGLAR